MQQQIFELLLEQEDVSWKSILQELVKKEEMNPWDVDISMLSQKYIQIIKEMQEHDFRISGKILLAAAFLLKMKSAYLVDHDIAHLDRLIGQNDGSDESEIFEELENGEKRVREQFSLVPRNPQPRTRKVSLQELVDALQRAMQSRKRILAQQRPVKFVMPTRKMDILGVIRDLYHKISYYTVKENTDTLTFSKLLPPRAGRQEKVYTFIPLLHLETQHKLAMAQEKPFEEISVTLLKKKNSSS